MLKDRALDEICIFDDNVAICMLEQTLALQITSVVRNDAEHMLKKVVQVYS